MRSLLLAIACIAMLAACKKSKNANELAGKWQLTGYKARYARQ